MTATLLIRRDRLGETRLRSGLDDALAAGQVRVAPELLALTANNIDFMADNGFFGARRVLLSSASSKTAYGTAFLLSRREGIQVVGLTSTQNREFCTSLGCYSKVLSYQALDEVPADEPCCYIAASHVDQLGGGAGLPGPRPTLFFAPAQAKKRQTDWGGEELQRRLVAAWNDFLARALESDPPWLRVERHEGLPAARTAYEQLLSGRVDPAQGHVLAPDTRA